MAEGGDAPKIDMETSESMLDHHVLTYSAIKHQ